MSALQAVKKTAEDWHRADIVAALHKAGWSLRKLSEGAGLSAGTLKSALDRPYPKAEEIIATAIGVDAKEIWPSRYAKRHFKPVFPTIPLSSANTPAASRTAVAVK
ncbi:helix-turn-helix domain-containing protein [Paludibacterium denitrificans]|uniref:Transcriptional regulator n=1 Tax=Paludibacterium denitrificans TaxID=2675226 RepID=A0A844G9T9_9NEIS|nr:helix-turn-helix domain-containing protein [Paludibacterium denitrificans]MTD32552.1 transcriptional regulator [Paludibacterium denitrificans]